MTPKLKIILLITGIILILLSATILTVCILLFEDRMNLPSAPQDFTAVFTGMQKINMHLSTASDASAGETRSLILTETEFNMLTGTIVTNPFLFSLTGNKMPDFLPRSRISAKDGILLIHYAHDMKSNLPGGRYINLRIRMKASAEKGEPSFEILSCKAGSLPIPSMLAGKIAAAAVRKQYDKSPAGRILRGGSVSLKFRNNSLILEYQPKELIDSADLNLYGSLNNRVRKTVESYGKKRR